MRITYVKLTNFIGVHAAMGLKEVEFSFENIDKPIIQIYGQNRCGKTVLIQQLHPFSSINLNGDERADLALIIPKEVGIKNIVYEVDGEVYALLVGDLCRGLEDLEHQRNQRHSKQCQYNAHDQCDCHKCVCGLADILLVSGSEVVRDYDACAGRESHEEADDQIRHRGEGSHCGEGVLAHEVSDNPCVHCVVELLEQHPQKDGHSKIDYLRDNGPAGHVHISAFAKSQ